MATVSFLWHLHQPAYRTADGVAHAPWVLLHSGGAYATLARAIERSGGRGQIVNIVPTLVEQLEAYDLGTVTDPVSIALTTPTEELTTEQRRIVVEWSRHINNRQLERSARLRELRERADAELDIQQLRDLQVLTILSHAGEWAWRDGVLKPLHKQGRSFSETQLAAAGTWLHEQPRRLLELWRSLDRLDGVEIATCPFAHPIMPLLIDTSIVREAWLPEKAPAVPAFRHPDDARAQLEQGLEFMRGKGFSTVGCWPPEGSVSRAALDIYAEFGTRWLVTDEGILEKSLGAPLRHDGVASSDLYRAWCIDRSSPALFFRDRLLSDLIGFEYGGWDDEGVAAIDLVNRLRALATSLPDDASIVIALDGENAWSHYAEGGGRFLETLMELINDSAPELEPATLAELSRRLTPSTLPRLHPGSWIHATFATWIGHPEKTAAWELLARVREALDGAEIPSSMMLAEGSDWFWWLGEDNPTDLAPLYDRIFRHHLSDACAQAGIDWPANLDVPIKRDT